MNDVLLKVINDLKAINDDPQALLADGDNAAGFAGQRTPCPAGLHAGDGKPMLNCVSAAFVRTTERSSSS